MRGTDSNDFLAHLQGLVGTAAASQNSGSGGFKLIVNRLAVYAVVSTINRVCGFTISTSLMVPSIRTG